MKKKFGTSIFLGGVFACVMAPSQAQELGVSATGRVRSDWTIGAAFVDELVGQGVPVLAIDRPDWPNYLSKQSGTAKAWRSLKAEVAATNPAGWRVAALARSEAWLRASPDAVTIAVLDETNSDPAFAGNFKVLASSQNWQGEGVKLGTPWSELGESKQWQWQIDAQFMRLRQLRTNALSGELQYQGAGVYDFDLNSQRSSKSITSPFLAASGSSGLGVAMSVAVQGRPAPNWHVRLRADDLMSRLQWSNLATEISTLNSQVTSRAPDGSLDYAPLRQGQNALTDVNRRIGAHWQAHIAWAPFESTGRSVTYRVSRKAGINQNWVGWDSGVGIPATLRWKFEVEPIRSAVQIGITWGDWQAIAASDGKGLATEYRKFHVGWTNSF